MIRCLTSARMSMTATVLRPVSTKGPKPDPGVWGEYVRSQDPITGQIIMEWSSIKDDPDTPEDDSLESFEIPCIGRGIVDGGIRVAGTTERFGDTYENIDFVKLWFPARFRVTKRDRITNIRTPDGTVAWVDEEYMEDDESIAKATVFNVNGVTPLFDAFNRNNESFALLERAEGVGIPLG